MDVMKVDGPAGFWIFCKSYLEPKSSKVLVISFEHLEKLCIFTNFGGRSSKIEPATPISILNLPRAWQS